MPRAPFSNSLWLKDRARSLNSGLRARLDEYVWDYPTDTPKEIIDLLKASLRHVSDRIDTSTDERYLATLSRLVQNLANTLTFFDNAHTEQTPRALAQMLEDLVARLKFDVKLVVWPQVEYNFTIRDILPRLRRALDNVLTDEQKKEIFGKFTGRIDLVSFPRIERENIFVHAVFGHELGHPIADEFLASERGELKYINRLKQAQREIFTRFSAELARLQKLPLKRLQREKELTDAILKIRLRGMQELISDVVAIYLFGPSALLAAFDVFAGGSRDTIPVSTADLYPPDRMRFRIMLEVLRREGYGDAIEALKDRDVRESAEELIAHIGAEVAVRSDETAIAGEPHCQVAYDWIKDSLADAMAFAKKRVAPALYTAKIAEIEVPELIARLRLKIPPNEIGAYPHSTTVDWRSSILAAWLWTLTRSADVRRYGEKFSDDEMRALQRITSMSIELSLLKTRHNAYKAGKAKP